MSSVLYDWSSPVCASVNQPSRGSTGAATRERFMLRLRAFHANALLTFLARLLTRKMAEIPERITVVAPHQDDETFGCGGLMAKCRKKGADVQVIFLTDGSLAPLDGTGVSDRRELSALRIEEARRAVASLGVPEERLHFLDYGDGTLNSLGQSARDALIEKLSSLLTSHGSTAVFLPHWNDGHSDHDAAHVLAKEAAGKVPEVGILYQYIIWKPWLHPLYRLQFLRELCGAERLDIAEVSAEKSVAIQAYTSQLATLPHGFLERFLHADELFFPCGKTSRREGAR